MKLQLTDSRRLTGANLFWDHPSAILDVAIEGCAEGVIAVWKRSVAGWLDAVGYAEQETTCRTFKGGASLLISAPIDVLYSMCELNEVAWASVLHAFGQGELPDPLEQIPRLTRLFDEERNPRLIELQRAARDHDVPFLWDDDEVSIGYGRTARVWKPDQLPLPMAVDWQAIESIPLALVTGTNGKSTTVRMIAAVMTASGARAGLTSTDFIRVGERVIDTGDYSGTGGARTLLRQPDVEMAVLEVARGGLLRRGLGVEHANVAVVTNVAADHLGEWGIHTVEELIPAKFIVHRALGPRDVLVLNADDPGLVEHSMRLENRILWYSLSADNPLIRQAQASAQDACYFDKGELIAEHSGARRSITSAQNIPATRDGIVRYNIGNALAAMAVGLTLGIEDKAIAQGLSRFRGDESDNPGRGNWFEHEGIQILIDFAHNEHGMAALADTVTRVPAERVILLMGQAGDRLDKDIADLVAAASRMQPDTLMIADLPGYERGRKAFEVQALIRRHALEQGLADDQIKLFDSPQEATAMALQQARPGDLLVLLALTQRTEALALVHEFMER